MDGSVPQWLCERLVHKAVLVEERQAVEARAGHDYLEVIATPGAILDVELVRVGERPTQQQLETFGSHAVMLLTTWLPTGAVAVTRLQARVSEPEPARCTSARSRPSGRSRPRSRALPSASMRERTAHGSRRSGGSRSSRGGSGSAALASTACRRRRAR